MNSWKRVSRWNKCPICEHDTWCLYSDNAVLCMRARGGRPFHLKSGEDGWLYQIGQTVSYVRAKPEPEPVIDVAAIMAQCTCAGVPRLAQELSVSVDALYALECGWSIHHRAWAFPMRDGAGGYIGVRLRTADGSKFAVKGSHAGIFLPRCEPDKTVVVCEGPSDCAAALTLGYFAIGRPSCSGGVQHLRIAFKRLGIKKAIVVADDDDPGLRGAQNLQEHLSIPSCILVMPAKDIRDYVAAGGNRLGIESMVRCMVWRNQ